MNLFLQKCEVTNPDVWMEATGMSVPVGHPEWRLLDHPVEPGHSADFLDRESALTWARDNGHYVVFLLGRK